MSCWSSDADSVAAVDPVPVPVPAAGATSAGLLVAGAGAGAGFVSGVLGAYDCAREEVVGLTAGGGTVPIVSREDDIWVDEPWVVDAKSSCERRCRRETCAI